MKQDITKLSEASLINNLRLLYPSKSKNRILLAEIERRQIKNNPHVLKYLMELREMSIYNWTVNKLILTLYDYSHECNKFVDSDFFVCKHKDISEKMYKLRNVVHSIKNKKATEEFMEFISYLEHLVINLNFGNDTTKKDLLNNYLKFIIDFIEVISKIRLCTKYKIQLKNGTFIYKETWLYAIHNKRLVCQILFLILVNTYDIADTKIKLVNNSLQRRLFVNSKSDYRELYDIITDVSRRYNKCMQKPTSSLQDLEECDVSTDEFEFCIPKASVSTDIKCTEWYNARTRYD